MFKSIYIVLAVLTGACFSSAVRATNSASEESIGTQAIEESDLVIGGSYKGDNGNIVAEKRFSMLDELKDRGVVKIKSAGHGFDTSGWKTSRWNS